MKRHVLTGTVLIAAVLIGTGSSALADPAHSQDPNSQQFVTTCGTVDVNGSGAAAFLDGAAPPLVGKSFSFVGTFTVTVGGTTYGPFPDSFSKDQGVQGVDPSRLTTCTFTPTFTDTSKLTQHTFGFLQTLIPSLDPSLIGTDVTFTETGTFTVQVLTPSG
jgi:hypothetical protein